MAEKSNAPESRVSSVKNSTTRVSVRVRKTLLSQKVLNTMRLCFQLTNSVILERHFNMTVQSKRKHKIRYAIRGRRANGLRTHKKDDNQPRHVEHEWTRGIKRKSFKTDDANHAADWIAEMKMLPDWKEATQKNFTDNQASWPRGLKSMNQEIL